jgi:hypothetical protein
MPANTSNPDTRLVLSAPEQEPWRVAEWQRLWLAVQARPWTSLALVPASEGAPDHFTVLVAVILSRTGMVHLGSPIQVADATQVPLAQLTAFVDEVRRITSMGEKILVALPPAGKNPVTAAIAKATDAALLCVLLERMGWGGAKRTVAEIGASHFLGSAIFHPHQLENVK